MRLRALGDASKHTEQGEEFLKATGSTLEILEAVPQKAPAWHTVGKGEQKHGINYSCKLSNAHGSYSFDFWGSIRDAEMVKLAEEVQNAFFMDTPLYFHVSDFLKEKTGTGLNRLGNRTKKEVISRVREAVKPTSYTILTALHDDAGASFEDFCSSYGYDTDSRSAERAYKAVCEQERQMRKLYDRAELEALQEIT